MPPRRCRAGAARPRTDRHRTPALGGFQLRPGRRRGRLRGSRHARRRPAGHQPVRTWPHRYRPLRCSLARLGPRPRHNRLHHPSSSPRPVHARQGRRAGIARNAGAGPATEPSRPASTRTRCPGTSASSRPIPTAWTSGTAWPPVSRSSSVTTRQLMPTRPPPAWWTRMAACWLRPPDVPGKPVRRRARSTWLSTRRAEIPVRSSDGWTGPGAGGCASTGPSARRWGTTRSPRARRTCDAHERCGTASPAGARP